MQSAGLLAGLLAGVLYGVAAVLQAHAVRRLPTSIDRLVPFARAAARDLRIAVVLASYAAGFVAHVVAIRLVPLYLAQVAIAVALPVASVTALLLGESASRMRWGLVGAVTTGLVLLALAAGEPGPSTADGVLAVALWGLAAGLAVTGRLLGRRRGGGLAVGALSGVGYAAIALAVRGVDDSWSAASLFTLAVIPVLGVLAFWLYSVALDRGAVATATAGQVVVQTGLPAIVGLMAFGDGVRTGWWPALIVGLVLAVAASARLEQAQAAG